MKISSSLSINCTSNVNAGKAENSNEVKKKKTSLLGENVKRNSALEELLKQKQNLIDSKNALVDETLKSGKDPSSIKDRVHSIEIQIKEIDAQISKVQVEEQNKALGTDEKSKKTEKSKEKSKNNSSNSTEAVNAGDQMDSLLMLSGNLAKVHVLSSEKKSMDGETRVLKSEIKLDRSRGVNPIRKEERVVEIQNQIEKITKNMGDNLSTINNGVKTVREGSTYSEAIDKNQDNLSPEQIQVSQNIQVYNDNLPENAKQDGEKVNATA